MTAMKATLCVLAVLVMVGMCVSLSTDRTDDSQAGALKVASASSRQFLVKRQRKRTRQKGLKPKKKSARKKKPKKSTKSKKKGAKQGKVEKEARKAMDKGNGGKGDKGAAKVTTLTQWLFINTSNGVIGLLSDFEPLSAGQEEEEEEKTL